MRWLAMTALVACSSPAPSPAPPPAPPPADPPPALQHTFRGAPPGAVVRWRDRLLGTTPFVWAHPREFESVAVEIELEDYETRSVLIGNTDDDQAIDSSLVKFPAGTLACRDRLRAVAPEAKVRL